MFATIIALIGRSGVGKDTVADMIIDTHPVFKKVRLAMPVKESVKSLYNWSDEHLETARKEDIDEDWLITPRDAMIHMTNTMKQFNGPDFFWRRFMQDYDQGKHGKFVVLPDVRYKADVENLLQGNLKYQTLLVKIERNKVFVNHYDDKQVPHLFSHEVLQNNGTKAELRIHLNKILQKYIYIDNKCYK